uniref:Uncharacterized protein n=1 Tax=Candidatus Methanogaster sp. ANME-2c ERB4 TaxID=2759911 RepID=A0A7G9YLN7_9EURY|nr:hypothetical protein MOGPJHGO_00024 [Methanosarcinales archaeon ANME-2c ERB4]
MAQHLISICIFISNHADVYVREWLLPPSRIGTEEVDRDHVPIFLEGFDYLIDLFCVFWMSLVLRQSYHLSAFGNNVCVPMEKKVSLCTTTFTDFHRITTLRSENNVGTTQDAGTCIYRAHDPDLLIKTLNTCADVVTDTT